MIQRRKGAIFQVWLSLYKLAGKNDLSKVTATMLCIRKRIYLLLQEISLMVYFCHFSNNLWDCQLLATPLHGMQISRCRVYIHSLRIALFR